MTKPTFGELTIAWCCWSTHVPASVHGLSDILILHIKKANVSFSRPFVIKLNNFRGG